MGYARNGGGQAPNNHPYHTNAYMNDLSNLTTNDLQQSSYEKQQVREYITFLSFTSD